MFLNKVRNSESLSYLKRGAHAYILKRTKFKCLIYWGFRFLFSLDDGAELMARHKVGPYRGAN